jgi:hypothetical protein
MSARAEARPPNAHPFELRHLRSRAASDFGQALIAALPSLAAPPGELRAVGLSMRHHGHTEAVLFLRRGTEAPMTEQRSSISKELREAFREAIEKYGDWRYGEPEPEGSWNLQPTAISWICEFVSIYDDSMPADLWLRLKKAMRLPGHLPSDRSYGGAARFLQHLINERKEDFLAIGHR